jgi:hypothetical protein
MAIAFAQLKQCSPNEWLHAQASIGTVSFSFVRSRVWAAICGIAVVIEAGTQVTGLTHLNDIPMDFLFGNRCRVVGEVPKRVAKVLFLVNLATPAPPGSGARLERRRFTGGRLQRLVRAATLAVSRANKPANLDPASGAKAAVDRLQRASDHRAMRAGDVGG